ncbi:MAG: hypothetical protein LC777_02315, partial [Actinobacteria bacterium]|nr:hypothetical protein [Actinomycetota bacterium]
MTARRADALVGVAGSALGAATAAAWGNSSGAIATAAILGAALAGSRRWPRATWVVAVAILAASPLLGQSAVLPAGGSDFPAYGLVAAHAFYVGRGETRRGAVAGLIALMAASQLVDVAAGGWPGGFLAAIAAAAWGGGRALRHREQTAAQLLQRSHELQDEREAHA